MFKFFILSASELAPNGYLGLNVPYRSFSSFFSLRGFYRTHFVRLPTMQVCAPVYKRFNHPGQIVSLFKLLSKISSPDLCSCLNSDSASIMCDAAIISSYFSKDYQPIVLQSFESYVINCMCYRNIMESFKLFFRKVKEIIFSKLSAVKFIKSF